jgi:soluble lytic murein transglycosylase
MKTLILILTFIISITGYASDEDILNDIRRGTPKKIWVRSQHYLLPIIDIAKSLDMDPKVIYAMAWRETHFRIRKSKKGASGLLQVMPETRKELLKKNLGLVKALKIQHSFDSMIIGSDQIENIILGTLYIKKLQKMFDGNMKLAIIAYNMGPYRIKRKLRKGIVVGNNHQYFKKINKSLIMIAGNI